MRWWPVPLILGAAAVALGWVWMFHGPSRQHRYIATLEVLFGLLVALLVWLVFASRLPRRLRLGVTGSVIGLIAAGAATLEIRGVSGDLVPILAWRWSSRAPALPTDTIPAPTPASRPRGDYPQFLGPHRNGTVDGPRLARDWKAQPPVELWRHPVGLAWSGFAVAGPFAVTQEQRGEKECVVCYDVLSGRTLWVHEDTARYATTIAGEGPRATPTIAGRRVLTQGATGLLNCLDLATGARLWSKDIVAESGREMPTWGVAGSPLVVGSRVFIHAGGTNERSRVALDLDTGRFVWGAGSGGMDYSSPALARLAGREQVLIFTGSGVVAHALEDGRILWRHPWRGGHPHVTVPLVLPGDRVAISSGYGTGCEVIEIAVVNGAWTVRPVWKSIRLKSKFANLLHHGGFIYGLDDGILVCLDAADGALKWKEGRYGHGQLILAGDLLLVMAEAGDVILIDPTPEGLRELSRLPVFRAKTWNPPALAGDLLLVRNDQEAACFRLPVEK